MPSPNDLANAVRRIINRAAQFSREDKDDQATIEYMKAAEQALATAWVHTDNPALRSEISKLNRPLMLLRENTEQAYKVAL